MKIKSAVFTLIIFMVSSCFLCSDAEETNKTLREMFLNNEAVIYSLNIRTFNAEDKNANGIIDFSNGEKSGNFINAINRLDEIKALGINTLHLLPITPVGKIKALGTAGSLYALSDFTSVNHQLTDPDSELSPKDQAKLFIDECHKRGIKVIVDLPSCGSYDLYINRPDLFLLDKNSAPVIPSDWDDVRLFNIPDNEKLLNSDIFLLHKFFVSYMIYIGADGIRADVATMKPYIFWHELIKFAREKKKDFLFLAEASEKWNTPVSDKAYFTDYKRLLAAGFDGYYGDFFDLKNWNTMNDLTQSITNRQKVLKKFNEKKSVIGSFETHDVVSPLLTGGENFSKIIIWLNATLPLNPYYVDGFLQADDYIYEYSNKKAAETFTDDEFYYVHQGQIDIFNFSRKPGSDSNVLINEHLQAMKLRRDYFDQITKGNFIPLNSDNNKIYAYMRSFNKKHVFVIINRNLVNSEDVEVNLKNINQKMKIKYIKEQTGVKIEKSKLKGRLRPAAIVIFTAE